jgi:hypothetical protein
MSIDDAAKPTALQPQSDKPCSPASDKIIPMSRHTHQKGKIATKALNADRTHEAYVKNLYLPA